MNVSRAGGAVRLVLLVVLVLLGGPAGCGGDGGAATADAGPVGEDASPAPDAGPATDAGPAAVDAAPPDAAPLCPNGDIDPGEACDDGNAVDGDGCNATCTSTEVCGNGIQDVGEACDGEDYCDGRCYDARVPLPDADGDTIADLDEGAATGVDTDQDGTADYLDLDSDGDGILDADEVEDQDTHTPPCDTDGDGTPDFLDDDTDGDGIPDAIEGTGDPDGDGVTSFRDLDADGDTILDAEEGAADRDGDGAPNFLDLDSDGDTVSDLDEAGDADVATPAVDTNGDGAPDFLDLDSDGDQLADALEAYCSNLGLFSRYYADTDGDGFGDLAEWAVGSNPCDAAQGVLDVVDYFFELPSGGPAQTQVLELTPRVTQTDVFFSVDTTGSMSGEVATLRSGLASIVMETTARVSNSAFGVAEWQDYPASPYGDPGYGDLPWRRLLAPTTDSFAAQTGVNSLTLRNGWDNSEAGYESLYQLATGAGTWAVPADVPAGRLGGAGFRSGSLPIVLHVTDAPSHVASDYPADYAAHSAAQTLAALTALGVRVISVHSDTWDTTTSITQLTEISNSTGATVPVCGFKTGATTWACGTDLCCTNLMSATPAGVPPVDGRCTLMYRIPGSGANLGAAAVQGIDAIVKYATFDVVSVSRDDGDAGTVDTSCFLKRIEAQAFVPPPAEPELSCTPVATAAAFNGAAYNNGFQGFAAGTSSVAQPGSRLQFTVEAANDGCQLPGSEAVVLTAYVDLVDQKTGTILGTRAVTILVPPDLAD